MVVWLLLAGAAGGFLAGLLGVGGGVIFAPVLLAVFTAMGVPAAQVPPLVVGTSLLCTMLTAVSSAFAHYRHDAVNVRTATLVGLGSAVSVYLTKAFVTTQPWYTPELFALVFGCVLAVVAFRMVWASPSHAQHRPPPPPAVKLGAIGLASGAVASSAGVGGGIILVPLFDKLLHMPMRRASGTSSATIVITALAGALTYALAAAPESGRWVVGYVDLQSGLALAVPALIMARVGVHVAHHLDTRYLRWAFAALAFFISLRLIIGAF